MARGQRHAVGDVGCRREGARTSVRRGTFYTPRSLADYLVRETLAPLTADGHRRSASCRLQARSTRRWGAERFWSARAGFSRTPTSRRWRATTGRCRRPTRRVRKIRRTIARRCLFGVDLNPIAVQLARLSLWLTTLTFDAPLTFLDHHLRTRRQSDRHFADGLRWRCAWPMRMQGQARAGTARCAGREDAAALPLFTEDDASHLMRSILPARAQLTLADDRPETVHEKERLLASLARDSALSS